MNTPIKSKSQERRLTTTSYAVLSVLAIRDHSTYELTRQMSLSLHYLWPRAESNVYAEPKRLVAAGLATSAKNGRGSAGARSTRSRPMAGRRSPTGSLAQLAAALESEAALKVFFGEHGAVDDLLASIRALREDAAAALRHFQSFADSYEAGEGRHPERFALSGLVARLLGEQQAATARWAAWAEHEVSAWQSPSGPGPEWGVETLRSTGQPFPTSEDPVLEALPDRESQAAGSLAPTSVKPDS